MDEDKSAFKFNFRLSYSDAVEKLLYDSELSAPHHHVQFKSKGRPYCLSCNVALNDIDEHFVNVKHYESNSILETYHEAFVNGCEQFQAQQIFFVPSTTELIKCELCDLNIEPDNIYNHLRNLNHINKLKDAKNYWPIIVAMDSDESFVKQCDYSVFSTATSLGDKVINIVRETHSIKLIDESSLQRKGVIRPLIFNRVGRANICLLCETIEEQSLSNHIAYSYHKEKALNYKTVNNLRNYHEFWWSQQKDKQGFAKYFMPSSNKLMKCLICLKKILFSHSIYHVKEESPCAFPTEEDLIYEPSINWEALFKKFAVENFPKCMEYHASVLDEYYPENIMKAVACRDRLDMFVIQRQLNNTRCLLCHEILKETTKLDEILAHIESDFHKSAGKNKINLLALSFYHRFWMKQTVEIQMKSARFIPFRSNRFKCTNCKNKLNKFSVITHLYSDCKRKSTDGERDYGPNKSNDKPEINGEAASTSQTEEAVPRLTLTGNYSKNVVAALYGKFNRSDQVYTFQKRTKMEYFCLVCCKGIILTPHTHFETKKHQKNYENKQIFQNLINYHNFWLSQANTYDQVNFNPLSPTSAHCILCVKEVKYSEIPEHVCKEKSVIVPVPEEFQNVVVNYHTDIMPKFYSNTLLEATNSVLKTKMPLGCHWKGKITCFICRKILYRDIGNWRKHLEQCHSRQNKRRQDDLEACLAYHKFWMRQKTAKQQALQIYFLPHDSTSARCSKRHFVKYTDIFNHVCNCALMEIAQFPLPSRFINQDEVQWLTQDVEKIKLTNGGTSKEKEKQRSKSSSDSSEEDSQNISPNIARAKQLAQMTNNKLQKIKKIDDNATKVHKVVPSVENPKTSDLFKLLPNRMKYNIQHLTKLPEEINCKVCDLSMSLDIKNIIHHLSQPTHVTKTVQNATKYVYFCDICFGKVTTEMNWQTHLDSNNHIAKCNALSVNKKANIKEYECLSCHIVIFGDQLSVNRHVKAYSFKSRRNRGVPKVVLNTSATKMLESRNLVELILADLLRDSDRAINDDVALKECLKALEDALAKKYPDCKAHPFGSRVTGIGTLKSDLDVFVDIGGKYNGDPEFTSTDQQEVIHAAKKFFMEQRRKFNDILPITGARTPIIKVVHIPTDIDCDLSFRNGLSVENTKYIKFCINLQPLFRPVMLLLKKWGDLVNTRDEFCSYALCMLMVFYMQQKQYLIPVHKLQELTDPNAPTIDGWSTVIYNKPILELQEHIELNNNIDAYTTLKQFFDYYKDFVFDEQVVCPLLGYSVPIAKFKTDPANSLPPEMYRYKEKIAKDPECQFRVNAQMFVQDPFDLAHNLTKAVPKNFREKFKKLCGLSSEQMRN